MLEEADESQLWLDLLVIARSSLNTENQRQLAEEAAELTAIFTASHRTARANLLRRDRARSAKRQS